MSVRLRWLAVPVAFWMLAGAVPQASTVLQLNLGQLVQRADRIYRGTVLSVSDRRVAVGGGQLPVVVYRLRVDESFRGEFTEVKGIRVAEIQTLGKAPIVRRGSVRSAIALPRMPELEIGRSYLVMTTRPSAIGLSTTVGLGQGCFRISAGRQGRAGGERGEQQRTLRRHDARDALRRSRRGTRGGGCRRRRAYPLRRPRQQHPQPDGALRRSTTMTTRASSALAALVLFTFAIAVPAMAGGPLALRAPGQPYRWPGGGVNIPFNPDLGGLGPLTNAEAVAQTTAAFAAWAAIPTASATHVNAGPLPFDVDVTNFDALPVRRPRRTA